jgi:hypothetical protein
MEALKDLWERCGKARRDLVTKCFKGGDGNHQYQIAIADYHVSYAWYLMRKWGCPGTEDPFDGFRERLGPWA